MAKPSPKSGKIAPLPRRNKQVDPDPPAAAPIELDGDLAQMIARASGYGLTPNEIGYLLDIPTKEIEGYQDALQAGKAKANFKVAHAFFQTATNPAHKSHALASIFWLKARAGWVETKAANPSDEVIPNQGSGEHRELMDEEVKSRFEQTMDTLRAKK
jgi:hypothetical protein